MNNEKKEVLTVDGQISTNNNIHNPIISFDTHSVKSENFDVNIPTNNKEKPFRYDRNEWGNIVRHYPTGDVVGLRNGEELTVDEQGNEQIIDENWIKEYIVNFSKETHDDEEIATFKKTINQALSVIKREPLKMKNGLTNNKVVATLSIKIYEEQVAVTGGIEALWERIRAIDKTKIHCIGILHNRDTSDEDFWGSSLEKPHIHIILRILNKKRQRIGALLDMLGVYYRPLIDDNLVKNHGVETCKDFTSMTMYLMHQTQKAIEDGKEPYGIEELVSNLTVNEIQDVINGYVRVGENGGKATFKEMEELDAEAFKLGQDLKDFDKWYNTLSFKERVNAKMKTVKESYMRGLKETCEDEDKRCLTRTCIYIQGKPNVGKSFAAQQALKQMNYSYLTIEGGGTGKFDRLKPTHNAIIVNDDIIPYLLNMSDNYICQAYRRQKDNPYWCGNMLIVTSNLPFDQWLERCGFDKFNEESFRAAESRFYVCHIDDNTGCVVCDSESNRGSSQQRKERKNKFDEFMRYYNISLLEYADMKWRDTHFFDEEESPYKMTMDKLVQGKIIAINDSFVKIEKDMDIPFWDVAKSPGIPGLQQETV